mmetsp:Transcript_29901/g.49336  ORF Transcript_29901/g.49336 Transcript_29901/m.49336 type:complete len:443 (-) Transcript_29901:812-2140(-)
MHGVVDHGEILAVKKRLDGWEIKDGLQQSNVVINRGNDLDVDLGTAIGSSNTGQTRGINVNRWEITADLVALDRLGVLKHGVGEAVWGRTSVLAVVLDSKVLLWSTGVVTGSQDEGTKRLLPDRPLFTNDGRNSWSRQKAVLANPDALDTVGNSHLGNDLDGLRVVVTSITTDEKSSLIELGARSLDSVKGGLNKVFEVVLAHEFLGLLTETGSTWLLSLNGSSAHDAALQWTKSNRVGQVKVASDFAFWDVLGFVAVVDNVDGTNKLSLFAHAHETLDGESFAVDQRWDATLSGFLKLSNQLVFFAVKSHDWGDTVAGRVQFGAELGIDNVSIRTEQHEIIALLHWSKASTWDDNSSSSLEAFDSGTHGSLQLNNLLGRVVLGVDSLLVHDHWKRNESSEFVNNLLQFIETDPKIVGIEETVLGDILELLLVLVSAHGRLA